MNSRLLIVLSVVGFILVLVLVGAATYMFRSDRGDTSSIKEQSTSPDTTGSASTGFTWAVRSGASPHDLQDMKKAVDQALSERPIVLREGAELRFEGVAVSGEWAITEGLTRDAKTGQLIGGESLIIILRHSNDTWHAALPGTSEFNSWLDEVPETLISSETKRLLE